MNPMDKESIGKIEWGIIWVGLWLTAFAIDVTGISYIINSPFPVRWLVWAVGLAFIAVASVMFVWPLFRGKLAAIPAGKLRTFLIVSLPLAYIISSQVCGVGLQACTQLCQVVNISMILIAAYTAFRLWKGRTVWPMYLVMIIVSLIPHCICLAPINTIWHSWLNGVSPACEMMPLGAVLFALSGLRGVRPIFSTVLVVMLMVVMLFIVIGGSIWGFPWTGCMYHPGM